MRNELGRVYKSAVRGELVWTDATKAAFVLNIIAQLHQGLGTDARLAELENLIAAIKAASGIATNGHARVNGNGGRHERQHNV